MITFGTYSNNNDIEKHDYYVFRDYRLGHILINRQFYKLNISLYDIYIIFSL